jgi:hypothetical protein
MAGRVVKKCNRRETVYKCIWVIMESFMKKFVTSYGGLFYFLDMEIVIQCFIGNVWDCAAQYILVLRIKSWIEEFSFF